jgi:nucleoid-associated protein YgaU
LHAAAPAPGIAPSIPQFRLEPVSLDAKLPPAPLAPSPVGDVLRAAPARVERTAPVRLVVPATVESSSDSVAPSSVRVERGDSLWKIAARHLGDGRAWRRIAAANPQLADPNLIRVGDVLQLPGETSDSSFESGLEDSAAADSPLVRVERGDTLWALARAQFGRGSAWTCIARANQLDNPDLILPGQTLTVPSSCPTSN